jgi:ATP phosphoribosyltransferase regulatory subunit
MKSSMSPDKPIPLVADFQIRQNLINKLKKRFYTYGYQQIRTSTFEDYDMYSTVTGTVNKDDMIKVIDASGKVLVLRPDVTIPITRMTALNKQQYKDHLRLFYVLDIFRRSFDQNGKKESTQAGIECFGQNTPETDAEILMLAVHTLKDLDFKHFKIEIGHAGFFKELIEEASLNHKELEHLKTLIQSKNIAELETFLSTLTMSDALRASIHRIPLLYGRPNQVIQQAKSIVLNENMQKELNNLQQVITLLTDYGVEDSIVCNLGLINNMNYYTDIIFQGFTEDVGKPVLMGGRYDKLGEQYSNPMPATGFAFDVDFLKEVLEQQGSLAVRDTTVEIIIYYEQEKQKEAFQTAYKLREKDYQVLTMPFDAMNDIDQKPANYSIHYAKDTATVSCYQDKRTFSNFKELLGLIQQEEAER